jgi:MFS family permease
VLKYIIALTIPPVLCAFIIIPLFSALLIAAGLLIACPPKYTILLSYVLEAMAWGVSGFIMSLLISSLSRNREIMMTLFGVLIAAIVFAVAYVYFGSFIDSNKIPEGFWMYSLRHNAVNGIFLLCFALLGAWLIVRKRRRLRAPKAEQKESVNRQLLKR